ncbi:arginine--tRNA ligase [Clostridia bacterium]|nr:arginine--tRNA ligase [Clostridia bacterium]
MENIIDVIKKQITDLFGDLGEEIVLDIPKNREFGDYSTNIAMQLAKRERRNPRELAAEFVDKMDFSGTYIDKAEVAGAGFINFYLNDSYLIAVPKNVLEFGDNYGANDSLKGQKILLEYVSANPTGPMHMGNARGGALGDSLARVMKACGADTTREFYLNDSGNQIAKFTNSLYARYMQQFGEYEFPEDGYHGKDIAELAAEYTKITGEDKLKNISEEEIKAGLTAFGLERNVADIKRILGDYRVEYDYWFHESSMYETGAVEKIVDMLKKTGETYEQDGALWLKCGDKDEVLVRANGFATYFAADIAYHYNKLAERGFDRAINVWGADHHGHIARMKRSMEILGLDPDRLEVITIQLVRLMRGGEVARMSKRSGESITLGDLLEEIGIDSARYFFNMRLANSHFDFDLELAVKQSSDNPVFYVQYAHARICSIIESAKEYGNWTGVEPTYTHEAEQTLIRKIANFPQEVAVSAQILEPSRLTHYAAELAGDFHSFYGACKVMVEDEQTRNSRLLLVDSARQTLKNVLNLLGVTAPERM